MSLIDPYDLQNDLNRLEQLERASTRFVAYAMHDLLPLAVDEFNAVVAGTRGTAPTSQGATVSDAANYLGEDLTRMALDRIGASRVPDARLFGAIDYKVAVLQFLPDFAVEQALFVDSKAEKNSFNNCRVQVTQTSLEIRQRLGNGHDIAVPGRVDPVWTSQGHSYLTSTLFVKYHYGDQGLNRVTVAALPHKYLQDVYNPDATDDIWNVGPNAPTLGEAFRTRLNFTKLSAKAPWRVQKLVPGQSWAFAE